MRKRVFFQFTPSDADTGIIYLLLKQRKNGQTSVLLISLFASQVNALPSKLSLSHQFP